MIYHLTNAHSDISSKNYESSRQRIASVVQSLITLNTTSNDALSELSSLRLTIENMSLKDLSAIRLSSFDPDAFSKLIKRAQTHIVRQADEQFAEMMADNKGAVDSMVDNIPGVQSHATAVVEKTMKKTVITKVETDESK